MGGRRVRLPWEQSSPFLPSVWALLLPALEKLVAAPSHGDSEPATQKDEREDAHSPIQTQRPMVRLTASNPISGVPPMLIGFCPESINIWDALKHSLEERI